MARNVEIKARVPDLASVRARLVSRGAPAERLEQTDTFFLVPRGRLKLREFGAGRSAELIVYERPDAQGPKVSSYSRVVCPDADAMRRALSSALDVVGRVEKRREVFLLGRTRVHLDEVVGLGAFVELEVVLADAEATDNGEREARELMSWLGIAPDALVAGAYVDLLAGSVV